VWALSFSLSLFCPPLPLCLCVRVCLSLCSQSSVALTHALRSFFFLNARAALLAGIMGVFFNEKIMITAVCVIAFLVSASMFLRVRTEPVCVCARS
jgi:hypothetical protein